MTELWLSGQQSWVTLRVPGTVQSRPAGFITLCHRLCRLHRSLRFRLLLSTQPRVTRQAQRG